MVLEIKHFVEQSPSLCENPRVYVFPLHNWFDTRLE